MENKLTKYVSLNPIPSDSEWDRMKEICTIAVRSGLIPIKNPEQALVIALKGRELGIPPMAAFSKISVINGKPAMEAELMIALMYRDIPGVKIEFLETTDKACRIRFTRPGEGPSDWSFTMEDAIVAGLANKGPWKTYPSAMLRARCISAMARAKAADALMGCSYVPEELGAEPALNAEFVEVEGKNPENEKLIEKVQPKTETDLSRILSAFAEIGMGQKDLEQQFQCKLEEMDIQMLRSFYASEKRKHFEKNSELSL